MKFLILTLASLALAVSAQLQHNGSWGTRGPQDVLLFRDNVVAKSKWLRVNKVDLSYPQRGQNGGTITAINVYDGSTNGKGGYAKIKAGGVGQNNVTIRFKSQRGKAMNFTVEIYGQK
ncbi:probable salivary secreted peptide [Culex pipiens pallens]|uniref:probable salivary secreted peptide n=1 Tax=Culex pipiens pallens TaxID=42434 RepID=UPI001953FAD7|nr:probable salivary secreted peptide [Culex pipiens pallens]